jgi:hypothetical protein
MMTGHEKTLKTRQPNTQLNRDITLPVRADDGYLFGRGRLFGRRAYLYRILC